jgi:hypothetical protein
MTKVLLVGSGFSAKQVKEYDYKKNGWKIVAVNNGWMACEDLFDFWIKSNDYNGAHPNNVKQNQTIVKSYGQALKLFGGQKACGYSITLNAGYWVLANLKPTVIGLLGADMNYTPDKNGHTHIYGEGNDIKRRGMPDPDRMVIVHGNGDPKFLNNIYLRLQEKAKESGCSIYNLSHTIETRLPYQRVTPSSL